MELHDEDRAVAEKFDRLAREGFMAEFLPDERPKLDAHLARWALKPGQRVLEPGCGTGRLTEVLAAQVGSAGEVAAFDVSAEMVALARRRFLDRGHPCPPSPILSPERPGRPRSLDRRHPRPPHTDLCSAKVSVEVCDGRKLSPSEGYFDRIVCFQVFPHFVHRDEVLREFHRVLKPEGVLWIAHLIGREQVNEVHRRSSPPLNTHLLPDDATLRTVMANAGFSLNAVIDDANGFSVCGVPITGILQQHTMWTNPVNSIQ